MNVTVDTVETKTDVVTLGDVTRFYYETGFPAEWHKITNAFLKAFWHQTDLLYKAFRVEQGMTPQAPIDVFRNRNLLLLPLGERSLKEFEKLKEMVEKQRYASRGF